MYMMLRNDDYTQNEINATLCTVQKPIEVPTFHKIKSKTKSVLLTLMQRVDQCSSLDVEALRHVEKQITAAVNTFDAVSKYQSVKELKTSSAVPANKNIVP